MQDLRLQTKDGQPIQYCDFNHLTTDARRMPLDALPNGAGLFVCHAHYVLESTRLLAAGLPVLPLWDTLPRQGEE